MSQVLASSGSEVCLWDFGGDGGKTPKPYQTINPHGGTTIPCVRWNHNNQVLVSCGTDGGVVLSHVSGTSLGKLPTNSTVPVSCLAFSSGSRYLCSGGQSKIVDVWDLKKKVQTRRFEGHTGSITSICFGKTDSRVASSSVSGDILVHSVASGNTFCKLRANDKAVRSIDYSPHNASLLASAGDDCCVHLWDTQSSSNVTSFTRCHSTSASTVKFSPVSPSLVSSVGLDARLVFFDSNSQRLVKVISGDYPIKCFDFHTDGVTVALGTTDGHVLLYDLRKTETPLHQLLNVHTTQVNAVTFQKAIGKAAKPAPLSSQPNITSAPSLPPPTTPLPSTAAPSAAASPLPIPAPRSVARQPSGDRAAAFSSEEKEGLEAMVRRAVEEAVADLQMGLRSDINNLHVEVIRQFHLQQREMQSLLEGFTDKFEDIVSEVQQLRTDYEHLKHIY